ncbi:MAG TPA: hypothetical protein VNJ03_06820 [Vicinamibacterales bacterium]|nr:hypothetical protein [Vicinamibacterales bacterium]
MPLRRRATLLTLAAVLSVPIGARAQATPESPTVHTLTLEKHTDIPNGRIVMVEGDADAGGVRFVVNKLSILQPVAVMLVSPGSSEDLQLSLWKYAEDDVARQGSTRGSGMVSFQLRTEDDLQIRVASPEGSKKYRLAVWAGDEVDLPVPSPFVSQAGFSGSSGTPSILYVLTAGVLVIAVLLGVMVMRRKKA